MKIIFFANQEEAENKSQVYEIIPFMQLTCGGELKDKPGHLIVIFLKTFNLTRLASSIFYSHCSLW